MFKRKAAFPVPVLTGLLITMSVSTFVAAQEKRAALWREQRLEKGQAVQAYAANAIEGTLRFVEDARVLEKFSAGFKGFHPLLGGLSTGSGFALGFLFTPTTKEDAFRFSLSSAASFKGYQEHNLAFGYKRKHFLAYGYGRYRNFPQEDFFGLGPESREEDRTSYRLEDTIIGGLAGLRPHRSLLFAGHYSRLMSHIGTGTDGRFPSAEELFTYQDTPGLAEQADFDMFGLRAELDTRDVSFPKDYGRRYSPTFYKLKERSANPRRGTYLSVEAIRYVDRTMGQFDFDRYEAEFQQYIPFNHGHRVIAFRHFSTFSVAEDGSQVPFYLMRTLGGDNTLHGFREFRFRDRNGLVFNLEYRWEAWSGLDMALFADAGKVFPDAKDWNLNDLDTSYGIGFRFNTFRSVLLRLDIGRGKEGTRYYFKFGHVF